MAGEFEPKKFIDRRTQIACFEEMLKFENNFRIMALQSDSQYGKTHLLKMLAAICKTAEVRIPHFIFDLKGQKEDLSPNMFMQQFAAGIQNFDVPLSQYEKIKAVFPSSSQTQNTYNFIKTTIVNSDIKVDVKENKFEDIEKLEITGVNISQDTTNEMSLFGQIANKEAAIQQALLEDLRRYCKDKPVVLLIDNYSYDDESNDFHVWIANRFLNAFYIDLMNRPNKLLLVITGENDKVIKLFDGNYNDAVWKRVVHFFEQLDVWTIKDLTRYCEINNFDVDAKFIRNLHNLLPLMPLTTLSQILKNKTSP